MNNITEIGGPASWRGPDLQRHEDWLVRLNDGHGHEIRAALTAAEDAGLDFLDLTRDNFVLPTVGPLLEAAIDELTEGRGFLMFRNVPLDGLSEHQIEVLYWGMGLYMGIPLAQGAGATDHFAHVRDEGVDRNANYGGGLLNRHSGALPFHTDSSDIVGLLCINPAMEGGTSKLVSAIAVHDEIVRRRPDLLEVMYSQWWFDRKRGDGPDSFAQCPIYGRNNAGQFFGFYGPDLYKTATRGEGVPDLSPEQLAAMALIDELNTSTEFYLGLELERGDIQLVNNYTVMHSRSAYVDDPDSTLRRDLIRLWLTLDRELNLPESFSERGLTARTEAF